MADRADPSLLSAIMTSESPATLARLGGAVLQHHVTEPHLSSGFERFVSYLERRIVDLVPEASDRVQ
jgi:hypothetical protein